MSSWKTVRYSICLPTKHILQVHTIFNSVVKEVNVHINLSQVISH